ncbi:M15 family metallopeptidase [Nocardia testacea]|uniref:M15 family metallopeptidase n=1 Tax=Nocardia testacea TaxID=248551 RepID=UPI003A8ADE8F
MNPSESAHRTTRRIRTAVVAALVAAGAAAIGVLLYQSPAHVLLSAGWSEGLPEPAHDGPPGAGRPLPRQLSSPEREANSAWTPTDGAVPDGVTVFDDAIPAVAGLDPELRHALRRAATDAAVDGVEFVVNSGRRSPRYQAHLLSEAISKYGSKKEAARWVAAPDRSAHVSGDAVDIGPVAAAKWLSAHGAAYGLCQVYANEPWHYELRPEAVDHGCPPLYADPTRDPRMQR